MYSNNLSKEASTQREPTEADLQKVRIRPAKQDEAAKSAYTQIRPAQIPKLNLNLAKDQNQS